jgi:hypothetical protein
MFVFHDPALVAVHRQTTHHGGLCPVVQYAMEIFSEAMPVEEKRGNEKAG